MAPAATHRYTVAQALVRYLHAQWISCDGKPPQPFFAGVWGIFGHGNVAGLGQALEEFREMPFYLARNEQAMVHAAVGFAKQMRRKRVFACTSSIGPGATNMVTGAAGATINRLPVLLLPGDTFVKRTVGPVLQQLEHPQSEQFSVNDCFRPVSSYWDRLQHPCHLLTCMPEAMRVLTSPAETGAVTICLPQDLQTWAYDFPQSFFQQKIHYSTRAQPDKFFLQQAVDLLLQAERPLVIAGGGVLYSAAEAELRQLCEQTGIAVAQTQAGVGSLPGQHASQLGAIGVTGTAAANLLAREADVVVCVGTRLADFTTASHSLFQHPHVRFININCHNKDAHKLGAVPVVADALVGLRMLREALFEKNYRVSPLYLEKVQRLREDWQRDKQQFMMGLREEKEEVGDNGITQVQVLAEIQKILSPNDVVVAAAGSLPGDMHQLLEIENGDQYHMEYGYSCMGYEVAGGLGVKLAQTQGKGKETGEVFILVGDGSLLMLATEILTSLQENLKLIIVVLENQKFASIDALSRRCGSGGFGNEFRHREVSTGQLTGNPLPVDFMLLAQSLGANAIKAQNPQQLQAALQEAQRQPQTCMVVVPVRAANPAVAQSQSSPTPSNGAWWDVPVAEVAMSPSVQKAREEYEQKVQLQRIFL